MPPRRVYLESLGCSKALVDSEAALGFLLRSGYELRDDPRDAELLLLNTCSFIESAREQSVERILELARTKAETGARLAVIGCLPQRYADELRQELPEIDLLAGVGRQEELSAAVDALFAQGEERGERGTSDLATGAPRSGFAGLAERPLLTPPHLAYVKVGEGCSRGCSFCAIPGIRGTFRSRSEEEIETEVRALVAGGVREVNLISQDTAFYGRDRGAPALLSLVRRLAETPDLRWIRIFYLHPALTELGELVELFSLPRVVPYLDMPVQHASDAMLRKMRRGHDRARLEALLSGLRRELPDLTLRSTVLVGHPGESEADFDQLLAMLESHPFDKLGVFAYSREEGTAAGAEHPLPPEVIAERVERVQVTQMAVSEERNRLLVGRSFEGVVEALAGEGDGLPPTRSLDPLASSPFPDAVAAIRTERDAYEVDGYLFLAEDAGLRLGQWVEVEVTGADVYDLRGRLLPAGTLP